MEVNRGIVGGMVGEMVKGIPVTTTGVLYSKEQLQLEVLERE